MKEIKIKENGSFLVSADLPLFLEEIVETNKGVFAKRIKEIDTKKHIVDGYYSLCRCGESKEKPFCDNTHLSNHFIGDEIASKESYFKRAEVVSEGPNLRLLDDRRCAFARFCHKEDGDVWTLTDYSKNKKYEKEAIAAAANCPSGRLTHIDKEGNEIEIKYTPHVALIEDPTKECSGGIYVRGDVQIIGSDGFLYEKRNRYALCRCGESELKPFCDATHIVIDFEDNLL